MCVVNGALAQTDDREDLRTDAVRVNSVGDV